MGRKKADQSVHAEPHLSGESHELDPSEARVEARLSRSRGEDEASEHSVWDEPGVSAELAGRPSPSAKTYARWMEDGRRRTGGGLSWGLTLGVALLAGPWAVFGALYSGGGSLFGVVAVTVIGPLTEEVLKIAAPLVIVERRPFAFRSATQIGLCALAGGLVFAIIENLLYLNVYIDDPSDSLRRWRWTVCVALHVCCSGLAGLGVIRMWREAWQRRQRPAAQRAIAFIAVAAVVHGTYNGLATLLQWIEGPL